MRDIDKEFREAVNTFTNLVRVINSSLIAAFQISRNEFLSDPYL